jgi:Flp pilus assembly CpaE family ATPase
MAVTEEDVQVVADTTTDVALFLTTAQSIVTTYLVPKILDTTVLDSITLYLAAHLTVLTTEKGGQRRIKIGESDES